MQKGLENGATIGVFSPSYPLTASSADAAARAEAFLESAGLSIKKGCLWGQRDAYRSGSAEARADEFNRLLRDPSVDCLMASVGGFVTNGMLPYIDYAYLAAHPKPIVGMSDVTALLMAAYTKAQAPVYYGPNFVTSFARLSPYRDVALACLRDVLGSRENYTYQMPETYSDELIDWDQALTQEKQIRNQLVTVHGGRVTGRLIGGNLNVLTGIGGTPYMPAIQGGDILFLENTEEWAGYTERYVTWLRLCGVFDRIGGLILGKHRAFDNAGTGKRSYEIVLDVLGEADFPILAEADFSHCAPMLTLPIGQTATLDADAQTLTLLR